MIPRPDPVPGCLHCRADAVGQYEGSVLAPGPRPLCEAHRGRRPDWLLYAPAEPAPVETPGGQPEAGPTAADVLIVAGGFLPAVVAADAAVEAGEVQARLLQEARNAGYDEGFRSGREQGQRDEQARIVARLADLRDDMRRRAISARAEGNRYKRLAREARQVEQSYLSAAGGLVEAATRLGDGEAT